MEYYCLSDHEYKSGDYKLIPIREEDILLIKKWRNEQLQILRQNEELSDDQQRMYYKNIIMPTFQQKYPNQILFSFLYQDVCIGYGGLVHISWHDSRAEVSFLLDSNRLFDKKIYSKDFKAFLKIIKTVAFKDLNLNRIYTETFDIRKHHINILVISGFRYEGRLRKHIMINNKFIDSLIHGCLKDDHVKE